MKRVSLIWTLMALAILMAMSSLTSYGSLAAQTSDDDRYATEDVVIDAPWRIQKINAEYRLPVVVATWNQDAYEWDRITIQKRVGEALTTLWDATYTDDAIDDDYATKRFILDCTNLTDCGSVFEPGTTCTLLVTVRLTRTLWPAKERSKVLAVKIAEDPLPVVSNSYFSGLYYGDLHFHSMFTNQEGELVQKETGGDFWMINEAAKSIGLDFVTATDHTVLEKWYWWDIGYLDESNWDGEEVSFVDSCSTYSDAYVRIFPAEEVYATNHLTNHHMLVYGVSSFVPSSGTLAEKLDQISANGGFAFAAHPYDDMGWDEDNLNLAMSHPGTPFKGLQIWNTVKWNESSISWWLRDIDPFPWEPLTDWDEELEAGVQGWDGYLVDGLSSDPPQKVFVAGGSDAHGDFNYGVGAIVEGVDATASDNAMGKVRTAVVCPDGAGSDGEHYLAAVSEGRSAITNGPLAVFGIDLDGDSDIDVLMGDDCTYTTGEDGSIVVSLAKSSEFGGDQDIELKLVMIDETVTYMPLTTTVSANEPEQTSWVLSTDDVLSRKESGWCYLRVEARSSDGLYRCYTNPIWIQVLPTPDLDPIERGLAWLKANQTVTSNLATIADDGGSERELTDDKSGTDRVTEYGSWKYDNNANAGITALALQAYLGRGYGIDHPIYGATIERAINYLLAAQTQSGSYTGAIYNAGAGYETPMAVVALKSALKVGLPEPLRTDVEDAANAALDYITRHVNESWSRVSWRYNHGYTSQSDGDMSVNQWMYLALGAMDYTDKDIWNKIYNYINTYKGSSGDRSWIGYYRGSDRPRGNTLAAIWGLALAAEHGVTGADALSQRMLNYIGQNCPFNTLISHPSLTSQCVWHGAGYYYYIYELAKAMALAQKQTFCGENWQNILTERIVGQHFEDGNGYYWRTGFTDNTGYYVASGGMGNHGQTALALLSMQVITVPPGSRIKVRLTDQSGGKDGSYSGMYLKVFVGGLGAYPTEDGQWITTIPGSRWLSTSGGVQELEVDLSSAVNVGVEVHNNQDDSSSYEICIEAYQGDSDVPVDVVCHEGVMIPQMIGASNANINAVGGLSVVFPPLDAYPLMEVSPDHLNFTPIAHNEVFDFSFTVKEVGDSVSLTDIDIFATNMVDEYGNIIPASAFVFTPNQIDSIPRGDSVVVAGQVVIPDSASLNLDDRGTFAGVITVDAYRTSRSISVTLSGSNEVIPTWEWIYVQCANPTYNGQPLNAGDTIRAYDPDGILCGMDVVKPDGSYGFLLIYRDDPWTGLDEGAEPGDTIHLTINGEPVFTDPVVVWTEAYDNYELCDFYVETCRELTLTPGWNLISWNVAYSDSIENFIEPFAECVDVIMSFDRGGLTYDPELPDFSTLWDVDYHYGYWVRTTCEVTIDICELPVGAAGVSAPQRVIPLYDGWNLVSYWPEDSLPVMSSLASIMDDLTVALGYRDGYEVYEPANPGFATMDYMVPLSGYWLKVTADGFLNYFDTDPPLASPRPQQLSVASAGPTVTASRQWMSVYGANLTIDGEALKEGTTIEFATESGMPCGRSVYRDQKLRFTPVYGSDGDLTAYPQPGEQVRVFLDGQEAYPPIDWKGHGERTELPALFSSADGVITVARTWRLHQNYPNPFNPTTTLSFDCAEIADYTLTVYNTLGQVVTRFEGTAKPGENAVVWDASAVSSGVYLYKLDVGQFTDTKKMILMK